MCFGSPLNQYSYRFSCEITPTRFFFYEGSASQTVKRHRTAGKGGGYLFYSSLPPPPTHELPDIFCNFACETNTRIADAILVSVYLLDDVLLGFLLQQSDIGDQRF